jgi:transposase
VVAVGYPLQLGSSQWTVDGPAGDRPRRSGLGIDERDRICIPLDGQPLVAGEWSEDVGRADVVAQAEDWRVERVRALARHRRVGQAKAERLLEAAASFVAVAELDEEMAFEVGLLLDQYDLYEAQIARAEEHLASLFDGELARRLQTIPGVGPAITATLVAEIGDIWRFDDADQLLAYAGVHPAERSSGRKGADPETSWHMSKAGNAHLRAAAYRIAAVGITHDPVIKAHNGRKRAAGKTRMNALGHCMSKALNLVWGVWRNGVDWDPDWGSRA